MSTMCSFGHFCTSSNNHGLPGIMEVPCDLDRAGHEEERHDRSSSDPRAVLTTYLTFLEHKIGHLRGILCSTPSPRRPEQQHAIVSAELRCIIVQLVSIANDLATGASPAPDASPSTPPLCDGVVGSPSVSNAAHEQPGSDDSDHADEDEEAEHSPSSGQYEVIQIEKEEILAPHAHACKVCGKGFKRDANLRMHMRGHGDQYKTPTALAKPLSAPATAPETTAQRPERRFYYSCPYAGCKRNKEHRDFQPLKNPVCVKNHYRRSHCDKSHLCRRCGVKRFSVLADLRTHEKHCGRDRWVCSCGTTFARKDKLFAHVAVFDGHTPALPPPVNDDDDAAVHCSITDGIATITVPGSDELAPAAAEALNVNNMFSDFSVERSRDDGRGYLCSPVGIDFYGFDGFDLSRAVAMDF